MYLWESTAGYACGAFCAQGCGWKLAALQHAPRAVHRGGKYSLPGCTQAQNRSQGVWMLKKWICKKIVTSLA